MIYTANEIKEIKKAKNISDLPNIIVNDRNWRPIQDVKIPAPIKKSVPPQAFEHQNFKSGAFWQKIPAFKTVSQEQFLDVKFQNHHTVTNLQQLEITLGELADPNFIADVHKGISEAPMSLRISPYILSLINWENPYHDPLRIQFIPTASARQPDHPYLKLDALSEQHSSPVAGLVHRYVDRVLFLPLDVCPAYCRFCTRSYAIGKDTYSVKKVNFKQVPEKWRLAFAYIASRPEIEDVVISGGDAYMLTPKRLKGIGEILLSIPHIRRIRYASKGLAVMPMKILSDTEWTRALVEIVELGRKQGKEVVLHTHFNSASEITEITYNAMLHLFKQGIKVRNQSVLLRHVNDTVASMSHLIKKLSFMNIEPYYVYQHDLIKGVEDLRTRLKDAQELERHIRGITTGFNTPLFVMDAPGGGGKRNLHSYDYYDDETGVSVYRSPGVDKEKLYLYFDPIDLLSESAQQRWADPHNHETIIQNAIQKSGYRHLTLAR